MAKCRHDNNVRYTVYFAHTNINQLPKTGYTALKVTSQGVLAVILMTKLVILCVLEKVFNVHREILSLPFSNVSEKFVKIMINLTAYMS